MTPRYCDVLCPNVSMDLRCCTGCFCPAAPPRLRPPSSDAAAADPATTPAYSAPGCAVTQLDSDPELMDRASAWWWCGWCPAAAADSTPPLSARAATQLAMAVAAAAASSSYTRDAAEGPPYRSAHGCRNPPWWCPEPPPLP